MVLTLVLKKIENELMSKRINQVEPVIDAKDKKSINRYLDSKGWLTEHTETKKFEDNIKNYVNRKYAVAVPNGTIALYLSLLSLGIGKGKKVAVPNLTMIASINSILWAGAEPVLIDVDNNFSMDFDELIKHEDIDAVIYVPLNGRVGEGLKIEKWCKENKISLLEDSAHALGSRYKTKYAGKLGDISIFSFTPHKIITMGQGGVVLTDNKKINDFLFDIKTFNRVKDKSDFHKGFGLNFKITDLQASIGNSQFLKLEDHISLKQNLLNSYQEYLPKRLKINKFKKTEVPWFIDVEFENKLQRSKAIQMLANENIETRLSYPPLSQQSYLSKYKNNDLKFSESIYEKLLWMPSSINLKLNDVKRICKILGRTIEK